ncbi:exodeoxyribonuclease V subunit beta [Oceanisphaera sp. IT1-181]|uniref:exodeoxyribonuclease V subunit beta n=1 Tax=Oceanisphaera sp. IT1-181 TaxID=3081199 RepID=UPI0029CA8E82|nr:exodeoxyribonuclease V subunit beta [Oceanisphaera sp. IT1-181]
MNAPQPHTLRPLALRFALHGSRLIEASAGTGKTFTISALYLRLVLGHGGEAAFHRELLPPEILVVTFTEAATRELRDRIRARLVEAARVFRGELLGDDLLKEFKRDFAEDLWSACARRLDIAAQWMDEAAVSTIHGWCQRMLREHAFDSGSLFTQTLETDHSELKALVVRDYWRQQCYPLNNEALDWVIEHWKTPDTLLKAIQPLLNNTGLATAKATLSLAQLLEENLQQKAHALAALKAPWVIWLDEIDRILHTGIAQKAVHGKWLQAKRTDDWLAKIRDWRDGDAVELDLTDAAWARLCSAGIVEAWKMGDAPHHGAFVAMDTLREQLEGLDAPFEAARRHAGVWVSQRFDEEKRRRAEMGFDDMLSRLYEALHGENGDRLAQVIRTQFPVAMIDEFQDTDPQQYRIFDRIYQLTELKHAESESGDANLLSTEQTATTGLFLIGDPKQAIYAFRGADIHTYLSAKHATHGRHESLDTNFRSSRSMVNAVNRLFLLAEQRQAGEGESGQGAFLFRDGSDNPLPFMPVQAKGRAEHWCVRRTSDAALIPQPALTFWQAEQDEPLSGGAYRAQMAASAASEITELLNLGQHNRAGFKDGEQLTPVKPSDIAVLVRNFTEAQAIRTELAALGVRSVYLSDKDSIFNSQEALDLMLWLRACAEPEQDRLLRAALASRTLGLTLYELEQLNQDERNWERRVMQFRDYRSRWRRQGVLPMLHQLLHDFGLPSRLVQRSDGERALTNILHLAELLQQAAANLDGEQALTRYLSERVLGEGDTNDEQVLRLESDAALVRVVTIHKAKGLEYPLVFLPFICAFRDTKSNEPVKVHDGDHNQLVLSPNAAQLEQADQARLAEDLRLLYVALTRSRHACWLGMADLKGRSKGSILHRSAIGHLLGGGAVLTRSSDLTDWLSPLAEVDVEANEIVQVTAPEPSGLKLQDLSEIQAEPVWRKPQRRAAEHWWIASYSALRTGAINQEKAAHLKPEHLKPEDLKPEHRYEDLSPENAAAASIADDEQETVLMPAATSLVDASLHGFPRGPNPGTFLHGLLELAAAESFNGESLALTEQIARRCELRGLNDWAEPLTVWLGQLLRTPLAGTGLLSGSGLNESEPAPPQLPVCLNALTTYQPELEFWLEASQVNVRVLDSLVQKAVLPHIVRAELLPDTLNGMFKGFIDLVFEYQGRYFVVDYKSNWLGAADEDYTQTAMIEQIVKHRYDLQYVLYLLALHRQLKLRLPDYDYDLHMGGAIYWFIRHPQGQYFERPPKALIESLDDLFNGEFDNKSNGELADGSNEEQAHV